MTRCGTRCPAQVARFHGVSHLPAMLVIVLSHRRRGKRQPLRNTVRLSELCKTSKVGLVAESVKPLVLPQKRAEFRVSCTSEKGRFPQRKLGRGP